MFKPTLQDFNEIITDDLDFDGYEIYRHYNVGAQEQAFYDFTQYHGETFESRQFFSFAALVFFIDQFSHSSE